MEVTQVRRTGRHWRLTIGHETIRVHRDIYLERPLNPGDEVDLEEYDNWLLLRQYRPALAYALNLLAGRAFAEQELNQRIRRVGYRPLTADLVCLKLKKTGILDDADFARQWTEGQIGRKIGSRRIARELQKKGVSREQAEEALDAVDAGEEFRMAVSLAERGLRRGKPGEDRRKTGQRVLAMLARRGYDFDTSRKALDRAWESLGSKEEEIGE